MIYRNKNNLSENIFSDLKYRNALHRRAYPSIGNNSVSIANIVYMSTKVSNDLYGFKIAHISDLHNHDFGDGHSKIISLIRRERPDIIAITGDLIDRRRTDIDTAMAFIDLAVNIAPVYYVTGNHEIKSDSYRELYSKLKNTEVIVLENESIKIKYYGEEFNLIGLHDVSSFACDPNVIDADAKYKLKTTLKSLISGDSSCLNVLLSHRPELIDLYAECGADVVLSGHAHGGQARLPLLGGLYAPEQGILPKYTSGLYKRGNTSLIVSRGLGNSLFPLRIFNPPEVVIITLKK